jgi:hypothetical protein
MPERHTFTENVCEAKPARRGRGARVFSIVFLIIASGIGGTGLSGQTKATKRAVQDTASAPASSVQLGGYYVRLTSGEVYNFSVFDPNTKTFLNADSLLIAAHAVLGK